MTWFWPGESGIIGGSGACRADIALQILGDGIKSQDHDPTKAECSEPRTQRAIWGSRGENPAGGTVNELFHYGRKKTQSAASLSNASRCRVA